MKAILTALCLIVSISTIGQTQYLTLHKKGKEKIKYFRPGKRVKVETNQGEVYKGRLVISADQIELDGQVIPLKDIYSVRTKSIASYVVGGTFEAVGGLFTVSGLILIVQGLTTQDECERTISLLIGIPLTAGSLILFVVPGTLMLTIGKKHKTEKWDFGTGIKPDIKMEKKFETASSWD